MPSAPPARGYFCTAGRLVGSEGWLTHIGWPKPLALAPTFPFGFSSPSPEAGVMSKMILSGLLGVGAGYDSEVAQVVETEIVANMPGNKVVGTGGIAADPNRADLFAACCVEGKPAPKHIHAAYPLTDQWVVWRAVLLRVSLIGDFRIDRVAMLQTVKAAAGLHRRIEIGGREREAGRKQTGLGCRPVTETEIVGDISLLRRDRAAAEPLASVIAAGKGDSADCSVIGDNRAPHVKAESVIARGANRGCQGGLQTAPTRQTGARAAAIGKGRQCDQGKSKAARGRHQFKYFIILPIFADFATPGFALSAGATGPGESAPSGGHQAHG